MGATCEAESARRNFLARAAPACNLAPPLFQTPCSEYQGEDPWLASKMVAAEIEGIQSQNVSGA